MARIAGINIPLNKRVEIGLTYIYGIGRPTSMRSSPPSGSSRTGRSAISRTMRSPSSATSSTAITSSRATCGVSAARTSSG